MSKINIFIKIKYKYIYVLRVENKGQKGRFFEKQIFIKT